SCSTGGGKIPDALMQKVRAQINNDATGWGDPNCQELGCGYQAESEPADPAKIRGNFTHDDTAANAKRGYKLTVTIAMANDYSGDPKVTVERRVGGRWVTFADQSGEIPVTLKYPSSDPSGVVSYRAGGQVWKWTATFEAFVSRFPLVDPQGRAYSATPTG